MKTFKLLSLFFCVMVCAFSFTSCGGDDDDDETSSTIIPDDTTIPGNPTTNEDGSLSINVNRAGTLSNIIGNSKLTIDYLIVSGTLNGSDIACLRDMMMTTKGGKLNKLDMSEASIVSGGEPYSSDYDDLYTEDNTISESMFEDCDAIEELILPNSVVRISHYTFGLGFSTNIRSITIGRSSVESIDNDDDSHDGFGVLSWMDNLEEINVHEDNPIYSSHNGCMYDKNRTVLYHVPPQKYGKLSTFNVPSDVRTIAGYAFRGCSLSSIKLPSTVRKLEDRAFARCDIKNIDISEVSDIGNLMFFGCSKTESISLSETMTIIPESTFQGCSLLDNITIPASVKSIEQSAFFSCDNLHDIYMKGTTPPSAGRNVTSSRDVFDSENINLHVPAGSKWRYATTIPWNELNIIEE